MFEILEKNIDELFARRHQLQESLQVIDQSLDHFESDEPFKEYEEAQKELELIEKNIAYKLDKKYKKQIDKQAKEEAKKQKELEIKRKQDQEIEEIAKNDLCIELELETAFENVMNDEAYTIEKQLENDLPF